MERSFIQINPTDNVVVALKPLNEGALLDIHAQKNLKRNEKILSMSLLSGKIYSYESDGKMFYFDKSFYEVNGLPKEPVSLNTFRS